VTEYFELMVKYESERLKIKFEHPSDWRVHEYQSRSGWWVVRIHSPREYEGDAFSENVAIQVGETRDSLSEVVEERLRGFRQRYGEFEHPGTTMPTTFAMHDAVEVEFDVDTPDVGMLRVTELIGKVGNESVYMTFYGKSGADSYEDFKQVYKDIKSSFNFM
jgi:hypothetical protein